MEVSADVMKATVEFVSEATPLLKEAEERKQAADKLIPNVVDTLVKCGFLTNEQRGKAAQTLQDPSKVLQSLMNVALLKTKSASDERPASLGAGTTVQRDNAKTASASTLAGVKTSEADQRFLRNFGL